MNIVYYNPPAIKKTSTKKTAGQLDVFLSNKFIFQKEIR